MTLLDLPVGWSRGTLDAVLEPLESGGKLQMGWSPQCDKEPAPNDETWAVLKTTAIQPGDFQPGHNKRLPTHLSARPAIEVRTGDLLLTNAGPRARCGIPCLVRSTRPRLMLSGKMYRFRPDPEALDSRFLEYFLLSPGAQADIDTMKTGISDSGLNLTQGRFLGLHVPVPSLKEQRQVVDILEDHLSRLDVASMALFATHRRLVSLRRAAVDEITRRHSEGSVSLRSLVERIEAGRSFGSASRPAQDHEWGIVKVSAMTWGEFRPHENKVVIDTARIDSRYEIHAGDILVSRANTTAYVGAPVLVEETRARLLLSDKSLRLIPRAGVSSAYLHCVLSAPAARAQMSARATGTKDSMRNISQESLLAVEVPLASPASQASVVAEVTDLDNTSVRLGDSVTHGQQRALGLRRALLEAAFSGRLTAGSPGADHIEELAGV